MKFLAIKKRIENTVDGINNRSDTVEERDQ